MPKSICPGVIIPYPFVFVHPYVCVRRLTFVQPTRACAFRACASVHFIQHVRALVFRTHASVPA